MLLKAWGSLILAISLSVASGQFSWGPTGHASVAAIAQSYLGANASTLCQLLLPEVKGDIVQIASWADEVRRNPAYSWSGALHYVDTPDWACNYNTARDCHDDAGVAGNCVTGAIGNYTARLMDGTLSQAQRAEALKFLVHFVGDLHQPLHTGFVGDVGGNSITGHFEGQSTNLHAVWDSGIITRRLNISFAGSPDKWQSYLLTQLKGVWSSKIAGWQQCQTPAPASACATDWAPESVQLACKYSYVESDGKRHVPQNFRLADPYYNRNFPVIEEQVAKAGVRLANVLNHVAPGALRGLVL